MPVWIGLLIVAPFVGSFLGVVVLREADTGILWGRSHCDVCGQQLPPRDLVPVASWLLSRGRCRHCGASLSAFYPAIELTAVIPVAWAATLQHGWLLALSTVLGWALITLGWIDWKTYRLPDVLTLPLFALGLGAAWMFDRIGWSDHIIGALVGLVFFSAIAFVYRWLRGRDGLGFGDAKLAAALGAWIAWQGLASAVFLAAALALGGVLVRGLFRRPISRTEQIPFGPFLAAGAWVVWLYGPLLPG